jgi:hypothetical protein
MLQSLKQKIESKRNSKNIFWKAGVFIKDFCWNVSDAFYKNIYRPLRCNFFLQFLSSKPINEINLFEKKIYSQNGEDGIIQAIFKKIGTTNKYFVEFGVENGKECNTRYLMEKNGWKGLLMDEKNENKNVKKEFITAENVNELFKKYGVPKEFDLLSIDVDGNDYWIWRALGGAWRPRVVVIEYNSKYKPPKSVSIEYEPNFQWDGTDYIGASLSALAKLGEEKGYKLVGCDNTGLNAFFVNNKDIQNNFLITDIKKLYRAPTFGQQKHGFFHKPCEKLMKEV